MGSRYWWFMSSVSQCHHVSVLYVFMNMALFNPVSTFFTSFNHSVLSSSLSVSSILHSKWLCPLCVCLAVCSGLWEREFSEESTDQRTFLGKKYTKVMMMHRAGKKKKNSACRGLYSCQQINAVKSNLSYKMGWTSVRSNLLPSYLSQCTFMIYLTRFSYFMYRLKTTTRQSEFLLWQQ